MQFFAHSGNRGGHWEPLAEHLQSVSRRACDFAEVFGAGQQAFLAGMLHDLGKYSEQFQQRLQGARVSLDHWSIGAVACARWSKRFGMAPALAIQGHHVGLSKIPAGDFARDLDREIVSNPSRHALSDLVVGRRRLDADGLRIAKLTSGLQITNDVQLAAGQMLDVRMLFSALVDADFLETEAHFEGDSESLRRPRPEGPALDVECAWKALHERLNYVRKGVVADRFRAVRERLLADCLAAGETSSPGSFTLTAPTGAGKTLAMLAFALAHARRHRLRRIVLAMPFLNIVDQTARQYAEMFSPTAGFSEPFVLEQHSLVESLLAESLGSSPEDSVDVRNRLRRQLAENWDAPIILTTTVQLLESLHSHKPGRCRKLHRLANAVILLDEAQTLPPKLAPLTLATLSRLTDPTGPYRSSVVFATATQPAFATLGRRVASYYRAGWGPREIVRDVPSLFAVAKSRTHVEWRDDRPVALKELARELSRATRVLAIVNLKRHAEALAIELGRLAPEGLFHLSTNMCPAHREATLKTIRVRLDDPTDPVTRVVATQCVEAGVDLDFRPITPEVPVLYRAVAPLDAIAQAAGRANRSGRSETARVVVFQVADQGKRTYPPGYGEGIAATQVVLSQLRARDIHPDDVDLIHDPEWIRRYYENLYSGVGRPEQPSPDEAELDAAIREGSFEKVAKHYRLIDENAINVVVPFDPELYESLRRELKGANACNSAFLRGWQRKARRLAVALFRPQRDSRLWAYLDPIRFDDQEMTTDEANWFWPLSGFVYDSVVGLRYPEDCGLLI